MSFVIWALAVAHELRERWAQLRTVVVIGLLVILVAAVGILGWKNARLERAGFALALRAYNDSARADQSRKVALSAKDSIRILGDSLSAVTRLAVQETLAKTDLDRALKVSRTAVVNLEARINALVATINTTATERPDGTRDAQINYRDAPYTVTGSASIGPPPGLAARIQLHVDTDPFTLGVNIGCQAPNRDGVRPVRVTVLTSADVSVKIGSASQDPGVCNSEKSGAKRHPRFQPQLVGGAGITLPEREPRVFVGLALVHCDLGAKWGIVPVCR